MEKHNGTRKTGFAVSVIFRLIDRELSKLLTLPTTFLLPEILMLF